MAQPVRGPAVGWTERLGRAVILAVVASLGLALAATQLLAPLRVSQLPAQAAASERRPSGTSSPSVSSPPGTANLAPSPLPAFKVFGGPQPTDRLLLNGEGPRLLDLATGTMTSPFGKDRANQLFERADGGYLCICADRSGDRVERVSMRLKQLDRDGRVTADTPLAVYEGRLDPDGGGDQGDSVLVIPARSADGKLLFVAHATRVPPEWRLGVDVVDSGTGRIVGRVDLGTGPSNDGNGRSAFAWVTARAGPDGRHVLFTTLTNESERSDIRRMTRWLSDVDGRNVGPARRIPAGPRSFDDSTCQDPDVAFGGATMLYAVCSTNSSSDSLLIRRATTDGEMLADVDLGSLGGFAVQARLVNPIHGVVYLWDPFAWRIARVDLNAGRLDAVETIDRAAVGESASSGGLLGGLARALSNWIAPAAAAKVYMDPALALSPDGSRIYALATRASNFTDGNAGSAGVLVLDAWTLRLVAHWRPLADLVSIEVSGDGRFAYALGSAGGNESGDRWEASLTVYDAASGEVREVIGNLGDSWLMFPNPSHS